ncbi:MAG: transcription factor E [Hadesarchaea archaeon]|nr:MAG: transcription factor E [Hadesarchaea archaeon]
MVLGGGLPKKKKEKKTQPKPKVLDNPVLIELLKQVAGEHGYEVAKTISGEELTDDEVAKRTGMRINLVRRILYDLYDNRVVNYRRVRDENSGWYVYYWQLDPERAMGYVNANRRLLLQKLEEQLNQEKNTIYFSCDNGCPKIPFEQAAENDFRCPRCGGKLESYDNSRVITSLENRIHTLRQQILGG